MEGKPRRIAVRRDGPYIVTGAIPLVRRDIGAGEEPIDAHEQYALCRCGHSARKPFCDGAHVRAGFDGTETAEREPAAPSRPLRDASHSPQVAVEHDPSRGCSGGIAVRGDVEVLGSDGKAYELATGTTLCRCGHSRAKPLCDGGHLAARFSDVP